MSLNTKAIHTKAVEQIADELEFDNGFVRVSGITPLELEQFKVHKKPAYLEGQRYLPVDIELVIPTGELTAIKVYAFNKNASSLERLAIPAIEALGTVSPIVYLQVVVDQSDRGLVIAQKCGHLNSILREAFENQSNHPVSMILTSDEFVNAKWLTMLRNGIHISGAQL